MGKFKLNWNTEKILGISAMSISFITLIIFVYQTNLMSKQNYLSILPYLQVSTSNNAAENSFTISLLNHGVGPAILESVTMIQDGKRNDLADYKNEILPYLVSIKPSLDSIQYFSSSTIGKGIAIPANSSYTLLKIKESQKDYEMFTAGLNELEQDGLQFEIVYKSIQNERWMISNISDGPVKLD
ncbi:MAG: hypothetical protein HKP53_05320 [Eudoraea sp.]|nr:hypothetical protein [Eudoraea sp.]